MTNLEELIQTAQRLGQRLEMAANEEKRFCVDACLSLEKMAWNLHRTANELEAIKNYN
jgi:uncharacterized protein YhaN